jgi:tetratricopeptide (TPR) repeat protein
MTKKKTPATESIPGNPTDRKKIVFYSITLLLPVIFLILLETVLQLLNYGGDTRLFIPTPDNNSPYFGINTRIGSRYFNGEKFIPTPRKDLFLQAKPDNSYRIFVLGGSSTAGYPYGNNITFPRILNLRLCDAFPQKRIEVVNMAMTAINSYTLLDYMDEILEQAPDALLIYAGHNEFYGALGVASVESLGRSNWFVRLYLSLQRFKTVRLLRDIIYKTAGLFKSPADEDSTSDDTQTQMSRIVKDENIYYKSDLYQLGKKQFYNNLEAICSRAKDAGIKVILSELVANIRDQLPFGSAKTNDMPAAMELFTKGRHLESEGNYQEAKEAYYMAKDLDLIRFRASEEFNDIIHQIGNRYAIPVIEMKKWFERQSPNGLIGNTLMHEHLHPNIDGYFLMAEAFFASIVKEKMIDQPPESIKPISFYRKTWGWTPLDSMYADLNIRQLKGGWPFKKTGPNTVLSHFIPKTKLDSVSLAIQTANLTLELGHRELAKYYQNKGALAQAMAEHRALIYTVPFLDLFYEPAIQLLLNQKEYTRALEILEYGIKFNESAFIHKWLGQLYLVHGYTKPGVFYLEKAIKQSPLDIYILYNLSRGYYNLSEIEKGDALLHRLTEIAPNSPLINELLTYKNELHAK